MKFYSRVELTVLMQSKHVSVNKASTQLVQVYRTVIIRDEACTKADDDFMIVVRDIFSFSAALQSTDFLGSFIDSL